MLRRTSRSQLRFGHARCLKIKLVENRLVCLRHHAGRANWKPRPERHAHPDHRAKAVRTQQRGIPCHRRAPIVSSDHRRVGAESVQQTDHIAHQVQQRVLINRLGTICLSVAAHIRRHRLKAGVRKRLQLVTPRIPRFGEAVTQQHQRARAAFRHVHANAIRFDEPMFHFSHADPTRKRDALYCRKRAVEQKRRRA